MMRGIYIAASGMTYQIDALNEVASNLANVNTSGYKRTQLVGESFDDVLVQFTQPTPLDRMGVGVRSAGQARVESQGPLIRTNNPLNLAISGEGYFQIQQPNGMVQVTRNGDFRIDNDGYLASHTGERVLGVNNAPIHFGAMAGPEMRVRPDGAVMQGQTEIGRIKIVPQNEAQPATFPASRLEAPAVATGFSLEQGYLEGANVNVVSEMVNMITINKAFNFGQKAITTQDNLLNKTVNDLGRVQ